MAHSLSSKKIIKVLLQHGFTRKSVVGSHHKFIKGNRIVIVKHPQKDIPRGTFQSIVEMSGLEKEEFYKL